MYRYVLTGNICITKLAIMKVIMEMNFLDFFDCRK